MIVLVTGAGGFIGSHLVDAYLKAGAHVIGVDNYLTGSEANLGAAKANGLFRNDGRVVANFVAQALAGSPLTIYGGGAQTRSFCYVSDLVRGILACAETDRARGEVINLGNPDEHPIREFAETVARLVGVEGRGATDASRRSREAPARQNEGRRRCWDGVPKSRSGRGFCERSMRSRRPRRGPQGVASELEAAVAP